MDDIKMFYNNNGVMVSITDNDGNVARFEMSDMFKAVKFVKTYHDNCINTVRDIELHEIALPNYDE